MNEIKGNKLLAEFLEGKLEYQSQLNDYCYKFHGSATKNLTHIFSRSHRYKPIDLLFRKDWNWLMTVVEEIETYPFTFYINETYCEIINYMNPNVKIKILENSKKKAVWKACIETVKLIKAKEKQE